MAKEKLDYIREVAQSDEAELKATVTQAGSVSLTQVATAQDPGRQVTINAASTEILAANDDRTAFTLIVRGTKNVFVKLGTAADNTCPELRPDDALSSDDYTGAVSGIVAAGSGRVDVFEV